LNREPDAYRWELTVVRGGTTRNSEAAANTIVAQFYYFDRPAELLVWMELGYPAASICV